MGTSNRYSPEVRERAVRLVLEHQGEHPSQWAAIESIAAKIGCTAETLRHWVRQAERDAWRMRAERALEGLGRAVDEQFDAWQLTPAEREVALFLLKGRGHKQIAAATGRSERTVRQHAVAVYQKSGLQGRAELAAFFLEDLVVPAPPGRS